MAEVGRKNFGHYLALGMIAIAVVIYLIPIYWILATSLKAPGDIVTQVPKFLFRLTLENYQKLMPPEVPGITYIFLVETLIGLFLFSLPLRLWTRFQTSPIVRQPSFVWNGLFVLSCLYIFSTTINYDFLLLPIYVGIAYWLISKAAANEQQIRFGFVSACVFALLAVCVSLADGGSKYFHQLLNSRVFC